MKNWIIFLTVFFAYVHQARSGFSVFKYEYGEPEDKGWITISDETDYEIFKIKQAIRFVCKKIKTAERDYSRTVGVLEARSVRLPNLTPSGVVYSALESKVSDVYSVRVTYPINKDVIDGVPVRTGINKVSFYVYHGLDYDKRKHQVAVNKIDHVEENVERGTITFVFSASMSFHLPGDSGKVGCDVIVE